ncbi:MAG TPA: hypothetical protein VEL76_18890, partial [Gemmataceae bacterium]|nr:hypothetical protein [Gemmataceae bacterium]
MQTRATFRRGLILVAGALLVAGSPLGTTGGLGASQDKGTEEALKAIRAELQKRCAKEEDLRGVLVVRVGPSRMLDRCALLCLVDDPKQAKLLKTRADAAVAANPDWKKRYPLGVEVQETVFPLRSQYVKEFQKAFATTDWATKEEQGVLPRTRLDDAYYNADGHLTLVGVWVANPTAPSADPDKAMAVINKAVGDLLGKLEDKYKIPNDREGFKIRLLESHEGFRLLPAGVAGLQTRVVAQPGLEEVLFQDASYDAAGTLHLKGLVGGEDKKKAIHRFIEGLAADSSWKERVMLQPQAGGRDNTWSLDRLTVIDWRVGKEPLQAACAASSNLVLRRVR